MFLSYREWFKVSEHKRERERGGAVEGEGGSSRGRGVEGKGGSRKERE